MRYYDTYLSHHGILGMGWGKKNGPPYPLGSGDHSAKEKRAAKEAGVKVGQDSGKGSIENLDENSSSSKSPQEDRRDKALKAVAEADSKRGSKYIDQLSTNELKDLDDRRKLKNALDQEKENKEKRDVINSGDKEKVKAYADKLSADELSEAMRKIDLTAKLNYVEPKPTTWDKLDSAMSKVSKITDYAETGIKAWNVIVKVSNSLNDDSKKLKPISPPG